MGMHVKTIKTGKYLYYTEMKDGKKIEKYCGSVNNPHVEIKGVGMGEDKD